MVGDRNGGNKRNMKSFSTNDCSRPATIGS